MAKQYKIHAVIGNIVERQNIKNILRKYEVDCRVMMQPVCIAVLNKYISELS